MATSEDLYEGREQSRVKHEFLKRYLERFAHIIGSWSDSITYVDCFSGPWKSRASDLRDSSFAIAIHELRQARTHLQESRRKHLRLRCFFVERDAAAFSELQRFAESHSDIEIECRNAPFEDAIPEITRFIAKDRKTFSFIFIDPTGWTGFAMNLISPLLKQRPSEVLVNLMTGHITRLIETHTPRKQFEELFGSTDFRSQVSGLSGLDRIDACVGAYCESLRRFGDFDFVCPAFVLRPERDRPHFNLIYATRKDKGVEEFKRAEKQAMQVMESERAKREERTRLGAVQKGLFSTNEMPESAYYRELRQRYLDRIEREISIQLSVHKQVAYSELWRTSLALPLVWEEDLRNLLLQWKARGMIELPTLGRRRFPNRQENDIVVWKTDASE